MIAPALSINSSKYNWVYRYKIYHIPFWFGYHYLWWTLTIGSAWEAASLIFFSHAIIKFSFYLVFQALGVYFNLYYLIPRLLEKGKYVQYISLLLFTIIITAICIVFGYYVSALWSDQTFMELWGVKPKDFFHFFKVSTLPSTVASTTLAMSIKLTKSWISAKRREKLLEKEKLETELKFLKSQFNPHFLFNTINSIFVLIHKNPDMASESLAKFSDLLRYQLYECNEHKIPLKQELSYLKNYIELERLRRDNDNLEITLQIEPERSLYLSIAPFVLIPFIENAFKHVSRMRDQKNWIKVDLSTDHHHLHFTVINSVSASNSRAREFIDYHGIGLKNVQRRLDLIYPGEHKLAIDQNENQFRIMLSLWLRESPVWEPMSIPVQVNEQV